VAFTESIQPIAESHQATIGQVVINWTIQQPGITSALVGARNRKQVDDNVKALDFKLTKEEIEAINLKLQDLKIVV
jgi:aryl-alcohol dehydrogenase-like predicted oxidoreductase